MRRFMKGRVSIRITPVNKAAETGCRIRQHADLHHWPDGGN